MIDVSVIIAVYNAEKNLEQCVRSVMNQTLESIEILCVNDGSTDGSGEILARLAQEDPRIRVIMQLNGGAGAARNHGLDLAQGTYLSFLDADDFFEPDMLEKALRRAQADQAEITVFKADFYNEISGAYAPCTYSVHEEMMPKHRPFAAAQVEKDLFKIVRGWAWDKLFLTQFIREKGIRFQHLRTTNDMYFVFAALAAAQRITTLDAVLIHQRRNAGGTLSVTREKSWMCFYEALTALKDALVRFGVYERFEQDYVNYALHFSLWHLNTLKGPAQKALYEKLRSEWFAALGINTLEKNKFYNGLEYAQYQLTMKLPFHPLMQRAAGLAQRGATFIRRKIHP